MAAFEEKNMAEKYLQSEKKRWKSITTGWEKLLIKEFQVNQIPEYVYVGKYKTEIHGRTIILEKVFNKEPQGCSFTKLKVKKKPECENIIEKICNIFSILLITLLWISNAFEKQIISGILVIFWLSLIFIIMIYILTKS